MAKVACQTGKYSALGQGQWTLLCLVNLPWILAQFFFSVHASHAAHRILSALGYFTNHILTYILLVTLSLFCEQGVVDAIGGAAATALQGPIQVTYREAFQSTILPSFERACHNMFQQINDSFHKGTQQCMLVLLVCLFVCFFPLVLVDVFFPPFILKVNLSSLLCFHHISLDKLLFVVDSSYA